MLVKGYYGYHTHKIFCPAPIGTSRCSSSFQLGIQQLGVFLYYSINKVSYIFYFLCMSITSLN